MPEADRHAADRGSDPPNGKLHPVESKYMAIAAVVGFLVVLLLTHGSLIAAFGALALIAGLGWVARRLMHQHPG